MLLHVSLILYVPSSESLYIVLLKVQNTKIMILIFFNFSNTIYKIHEDSAEAPKHVGAFGI
jgi:hypothetical protein